MRIIGLCPFYRLTLLYLWISAVPTLSHWSRKCVSRIATWGPARPRAGISSSSSLNRNEWKLNRQWYYEGGGDPNWGCIQLLYWWIAWHFWRKLSIVSSYRATCNFLFKKFNKVLLTIWMIKKPFLVSLLCSSEDIF